MNFDPLGGATAMESALSDWLTKVLIPFGSTLVGIVMYVAGRGGVPFWALVVVGGYLVVVMGALLFSPAKRVISRAMDKRRQCAMTKQQYPRVLQISSELQRLLESNRSDTIRSLLTEVGGWSDVEGRTAFDVAHVISLEAWNRSIAARLNRGTYEFIECAADLSLIVFYLNNLYVGKRQELEALIAGNKVPIMRLTYLKREWYSRRESHAALVRDWAAVAKAINSGVENRICPECYENLAPLI
ncbi:MAG: hypothetical protein HKL90_09540 [Elusimicrobia bacterium]|nr:hypothetical protein [Elusimicrobiota bacterium]